MRHRVVRSRWTLTGLAVVVALALAALAAPLLAPGDPYHGQLAAALQAPSRAFPLGTDAPRAFGASDARLAARHVLPNVLGPVIVAATLGVGGAIMAEAALSFVGLGAPPPTPSWGAMVAEGRDLLRVAPWVSLFPGLAIGLTVLAVNLVGDGLRDALDVRGGAAS